MTSDSSLKVVHIYNSHETNTIQVRVHFCYIFYRTPLKKLNYFFRWYFAIIALNFVILCISIHSLIFLIHESFKVQYKLELKLNFLQKELEEEPMKILILATYRTGSSLLGSILKEQNSTAYFYEPLRRVEKSVGFKFEYWSNWPNHKIEKAASTLNQIYSCQYVSLQG